MADFGALEKAKRLKEQATQKAAEFTDQAASLKDSVASKASDMKDKASDLKDSVAATAAEVKGSVSQAATEAKEASVAKIKETIDDFNAALPIIRAAGYNVGEVDIALGLPPKISASVTASSDVTAEHVEKILAEHQNKKLTTLIVKSLFQAWKLQNAIQIVGMKPRGMTIELGFVPSVTIKFVGN